MAYQNTFYVNDVPVTCTGTGSHDWITADFKIEAIANSTNTAYDVKVYARIDSQGRMNWTGDGTIRVTCNGTTASKQVALAMYSSGTTDWDGPAAFSFGAPGITALNMNFDLDLTLTTGTNGNPGPTHNSDGGNLQHFYYTNHRIAIGDGGLQPLIVSPTISAINNVNRLNDDIGVSASSNSINIAWKENGTVTNRYYRINGGTWVSATEPNVILSGLTQNTSYTIDVKSSNSTGESNVLSITVRTRYETPVLSEYTNANQYKDNVGISASPNSITLSWKELGGPISNRYYRINKGSWISINSSPLTISNLSEGTTYTIDVYASNLDMVSNALSITLRTRHNNPTISLSNDSAKLDSLIFKWTSDKPLVNSQYKVNNGVWVEAGSGTSGTITIKQLTPKTSYTIYFKGISTSSYDSLSSNEVSKSGTTLDMARITSIGDCIFGNSINIVVNKPSSNISKLKIWTVGNSRQPEFEFDVVDGTNTFTPSQDQLDQMYKCFTTSNSIPIYFSLITIGEWVSWNDTQQNKALKLTGIVKTAHISIDNKPRRAQLYIGIDNKPRMAIVFVGDENKKPRRCI